MKASTIILGTKLHCQLLSSFFLWLQFLILHIYKLFHLWALTHGNSFHVYWHWRQGIAYTAVGIEIYRIFQKKKNASSTTWNIKRQNEKVAWNVKEWNECTLVVRTLPVLIWTCTFLHSFSHLKSVARTDFSIVFWNVGECTTKLLYEHYFSVSTVLLLGFCFVFTNALWRIVVVNISEGQRLFLFNAF